MFAEGRILEMLILVIVIVTTYLSIDAAKKGKNIRIRSLPAVDAIDEAVGRSVEMDRPVHYTPGFSQGGLKNPVFGPGVVAGLSILKLVAKSCALRGARLIVSIAQPESVPIAEEALKNAYNAQELVVPFDAVRFTSSELYPHASYVLSLLKEERPGANILMGSFASEFLQFTTTGMSLGAMQIAGTAAIWQLPFMVTTCDYGLMGEELYAAMAYVERDPPHLGSLFASDIFRLITIAIIMVSFLAGNLKLSGILTLLKM